MKPFMKGMMAGIVGTVIVTGSIGMAQSAAQQIDVTFAPLKYFFRGEQKLPPADQQGFLYNGRTYVPLRFVVESMGETVQWDGETYTIRVGEAPPAPPMPSDLKEEQGHVVYVLPDGKKYLDEYGDQRWSAIKTDGKTIRANTRLVLDIVALANGAYQVGHGDRPGVDGTIEMNAMAVMKVRYEYEDPNRIGSNSYRVVTILNPLSGKSITYDERDPEWSDMYRSYPYTMEEWFEKLGFSLRYEWDAKDKVLFIYAQK